MWRFSKGLIYPCAVLLSSMGVFPAIALQDMHGGTGETSPPAKRLQADFVSLFWMQEHGLPESHVSGVATGPDGSLWISTVRYLVRFDGLRFLPVALPGQMKGRRIEGVRFDQRGGLWIHGNFGALRYADGQWWRSESAGMPRDRVVAVAVGTNGMCYLALEGAIYSWTAGVVRRILDVSAFQQESGAIHQLACDSFGSLWIGVGKGLYRWNPTGAALPERMTDVRAEWVLGHDGVGRILAYGASVGLRRVGEEWRALPSSKLTAVRCLSENSDGILWIGHGAGVDAYYDGAWHTLDKAGVHGIPAVTGIDFSPDGNVWLASADRIQRLRRRILLPLQWRGRTLGPTLSSLWVEPEGHVWAGIVDGGMASGDIDGLDRLSLTAKINAASLQGLYRETAGRFWFSALGEGVWTSDRGQVRLVGDDQLGRVYAIAGRSGAPEWLATRNGVLRFSADGPFSGEADWPEDTARCLWLDHDGTVWAGHEVGGLAVRYPDGRIEVFNDEKEVPGKMVQALYRDREGVLWIGGASGLGRWEGARRFVFTRGHGLPNENIRQISEDASGFLWLGTKDGIVRISKRDLEEVAAGRKDVVGARTFGKESGMENEECTGGVGFPHGYPPRDRLWFPTRAVTVVIDPGRLPGLRSALELRIEAVSIGRRVVVQTPVPVLKSIDDMVGGEQDAVIEFGAIDLVAPQRDRFRYELTGPVMQRSGLTAVRWVSFTRLPAGDYTFRVTVCNSDGVWNSEGATVRWRVYPPFWETIGFRLAVLCVIILMAVAVGRGIVRRRLAAFERERALETERSRIARDLHDEIGANLTHISILSTLAAKPEVGSETARNHHVEVADVARQTIQAFDEILWSVNPKNDKLRNLSQFICRRAQEVLTPAAITCHFVRDEELPDWPVLPQYRHGLLLAIKEALHNILKHAGATRVEVRCAMENNVFVVEVADNGTGFVESEAGANPHQRRGSGLGNMRQRVSDMGGECRVESHHGKGTRVTFRLPLE